MSELITYAQLSAESAVPQMHCGTVRTDPYGGEWKLIQATTAIAKGALVRAVNNTGIVINQDIDAAAAAGTQKVTGTGDMTTTALVNADFGAYASTVSVEDAHEIAAHGHSYFFGTDDGAQQGQWGCVFKRYDNDSVDVYFWHSTTGKINTALTASADYVIFTKTRVEYTTEPTDMTVGVAQKAITANYFAWVKVFGPAVVLLDTDDNPVQTDDQMLIPSTTTDGYASGTSATITAAEVAASIGRAVIDQTADGMIYADINTLYWTAPFIANSPYYGMGNRDKEWPQTWA